MRLPRIFREPPSLFLNSWTTLIVGGTILLLLTLFIASYPVRTYPIELGELPVLDRMASDADAVRVDLSPGGRVYLPHRDLRIDELDGVFDRAILYRVHVTATTPWIVLRTLLVAMRDQSVPFVEFAVRTSDGKPGAARFDFDAPLPPLDVHASVQDFLDAMR
ncbi:MAG: hypothetical protein AAGD14_15545 [Planctomycetota bacterium]